MPDVTESLGTFRQAVIIAIVIGLILTIGVYIGTELEATTGTSYTQTLINKIYDPISIAIIAVIFIVILEIIVNRLSSLGRPEATAT